MKKAKSKYIYWEEEKYLFRLPIPYWDVCDECRHKTFSWSKKGFILLKRIGHKRLRTALDDYFEPYARSYFRKLPFHLCGINRLPTEGTGKTIRFKRYEPLPSIKYKKGV